MTPTAVLPSHTIDNVTRQHPETLAVFGRFGLDSCCGGGLSIMEAARRHGLDLGELLAALRGAAGSVDVPAEDAGPSPAAPGPS